MSISDLLHESRHQARLRMFGWKGPVVSDEEPPFCEDCGASLEFCECGVPVDESIEEREGD